MTDQQTIDAQCSCTEHQEPYRHAPDCDLWFEDVFLEGWAKWDPAQNCLVYLKIDEVPSDEEHRARLLEVVKAFGYENADDIVETIADSAKADSDSAEAGNKTPVAAGEDIEGGAHTPPRCLCSPEKDQYCADCGVSRPQKDRPWNKTQRRIDRETGKGIYSTKPKPLRCACKPTKKIACITCEVQRDEVNEPWEYWWPSYSGGNWVSKCRHYHVPVTFPDGTVIYASSQTKHDPKVFLPDFGAYMAGWQPGVLSYLIGWADYGLPTIPDSHIRHAAEYLLTLARQGKKIEIGCVGGHGRTGTMMAVMLLHAGVNEPAAAVKWVRDNYCKEAIEGEMQVWYVHKYHAVLNDLEIPKQPEKKTYPTFVSSGKAGGTKAGGGGGGSDSSANSVYTHSVAYHWVMREAGYACTCEFWDQDLEDFTRKSIRPTKGAIKAAATLFQGHLKAGADYAKVVGGGGTTTSKVGS